MEALRLFLQQLIPPAPPEYCLLWNQAWCMPRSDWAAWVQAIGSVLALVVAFLVATHQARLARAQEHANQARRAAQTYRGFVAIAEGLMQATEAVDVMAPSIESTGANFSLGKFDPKVLRVYVDELNTLRVGELPRAASIKAALDLRAQASNMLEELEDARQQWLAQDTARMYGKMQNASFSRNATNAYLQVLKFDALQGEGAPSSATT